MTNAHTTSDLMQMQSLPLHLKVRMTKQRIREWYDHYEGNVYVSFSGGKDSTVLKHIVDSMYDDVPAVFVNTGLEYPEIQKFVREIKSGKWDCFNTDVEIVRPEMRFDEVIKEYGYPVISKEIAKRIYYARRGSDWAVKAIQGLNNDGTESSYKARYKKYTPLADSDFLVSAYCCDVMKKRPAKQYERQSGRKPIVGTMVWESHLRYRGWMKTGCNAFDSDKPKSQPMSFWTESDVLQYLREFSVPYCSVYGDIVNDGKELRTTGCKRTGCIYCAFGAHLEKDPGRFQQLAITHPKQYAYCIYGGEYSADGKWIPNKRGLGFGHVFDTINDHFGKDAIRYKPPEQVTFDEIILGGKKNDPLH